jgi:hypothetical protein
MFKIYQKIVLSLCMVAGCAVNGMLTQQEQSSLDGYLAMIRQSWGEQQFNEFNGLFKISVRAEKNDLCEANKALHYQVTVLTEEKRNLSSSVIQLSDANENLKSKNEKLENSLTELNAQAANAKITISELQGDNKVLWEFIDNSNIEISKEDLERLSTITAVSTPFKQKKKYPPYSNEAIRFIHEHPKALGIMLGLLFSGLLWGYLLGKKI